MGLSNRLPHLQELAARRFTDHERAVSRAERAAADAVVSYLACGDALLEAKAACRHGQWLPWLAETGIPERTAQRMMRLAAAGLKSDMVSDLGGCAAALRALPFVERLLLALALLDQAEGLPHDELVALLTDRCRDDHTLLYDMTTLLHSRLDGTNGDTLLRWFCDRAPSRSPRSSHDLAHD